MLTLKLKYELKAAINFVTLCCQQTAFIAGRGEIQEEIQDLVCMECVCNAVCCWNAVCAMLCVTKCAIW